MTTSSHAEVRRQAPQNASRVAADAALAWLVLAAGAVANGALRQGVLSPLLGEPAARVLSIAILLAIILAVSAWLARRRWAALPYATLLVVGAAWAAGSVLFEFALGRLVLGTSWSELLAAYDLRAGSSWALAPVTMLVGPSLAKLALSRRG